MTKLLAGIAVSVALVATPAAPAKAGEITTETLAYTFAFALTGTAAGAVLIPYAAPAVAPVVSGAYAATTSVVNGAITGLGNLLLTEPRMTGAVLGMGTGLAAGLYLYSE